MYNIDRTKLKLLLKNNFKALVGKSCKRIEVIRDTKNVDFTQKCNILRDLIKELDYEAMREIERDISKFSVGTDIQVSLTKPER